MAGSYIKIKTLSKDSFKIILGIYRDCNGISISLSENVHIYPAETQATLSTLRFKCFAAGSWISKHAGKTTLNISAIGEKRKWLDGLFDIVKQNHKSFYFSNA